MSVKILAGLLLIGELASVAFIGLVLARQLRISRLRVQDELQAFRRILVFLSATILISNFIPVVVDILTVFAAVPRSASTVNIIGIVYGVSNTVSTLVSSVLIWLMYRMAAKLVIIEDKAKLDAREEHAKMIVKEPSDV